MPHYELIGVWELRDHVWTQWTSFISCVSITYIIYWLPILLPTLPYYVNNSHTHIILYTYAYYWMWTNKSRSTMKLHWLPLFFLLNKVHMIANAATLDYTTYTPIVTMIMRPIAKACFRAWKYYHVYTTYYTPILESPQRQKNIQQSVVVCYSSFVSWINFS